MIEYRICWNASSNISFEGASDWQEWDGDENDTAENIQDQLALSSGSLPEGLELALEFSGFDWWIETRP